MADFLVSPNIESFTNFKPRLRLGIMASGVGTNLEALCQATKSNILQADIQVLIVNNPDCPAIEKALKYHIPYKVLDHRLFQKREHYDQQIIKELDSYDIEILVMAGWMRVVTSTLINHYNNRIVNIHPSLLPSFPGVNAIEQALEAKVKISGCTVHIVNEKVDSGPILVQSAVPISNQDDKRTLAPRIQKQEHKTLPIGVAIAGKRWRESNQG